MSLLQRALLLLLLCMNLGVAAWGAGHRDAPPPALPALDPNVPRLRLLSEVEQRPVPDAAELTEAPTPLDASAVCLSLGPFETPAELRQAMDLLLPKVERIQFREVPAVALRGYRVFLPPAASHADALAVARALSDRGVSDYYLVTAGPQQNTISLGIYRDLENARQRRDAVAALGYSPLLEPRTESVSQWWIDLAAAPGFQWQALLPNPALKAVAALCH